MIRVNEGQKIPDGLSYGKSERSVRLYYASKSCIVKVTLTKKFPWVGVSSWEPKAS